MDPPPTTSDSRGEPPTGIGRRAALGLLALVCLAALVVRLKTWGEGLDDGGAILHFGGTDGYYHLRRIHYLLANGLSLPLRDLYCHFPAGVASPWPPLFDQLMAAFVRVTTWGASTPLGVEWRLALLPAILGAISVGPVYLLARRLLDRGPAVVAALLFGWTPAHALKSFAGKPDHHVLEALLAVVVFWAVLAGIDRRASVRSRGVAAAVLPLALAAALLTWNGSMTFVGMTGVVLLAAVGHEAWARGAPTTPAWLLALAGFGAAILVLPAALSTEPSQMGAVTSVRLSVFQPAILAILGTFGLLLATGLSLPVGRRRPLRTASVVLAGLAAAGCLIVVLSPLGRALAEGIAFVRQAMPEPLLPLESRPLLGDIDLPGIQISGLAQGWRHFGLMLLTAPLGALVVARRHLADRRERLLEAAVLLLAAATGVMTLLQARFAHLAAPFAAILATLALYPKAGLPRARRWAAGLGVVSIAAASLIMLRPLSWLPAPPGQSWLQPMSLGPPPADIERAAVWLGEHSEDPGGYLDAAQTPAYGVMTYWDWGHLVMARARRPVLATPFLHLYPFEATSKFFLARSEAEGLAILGSKRVRYVISTKILPDTVNLRQFAVVCGEDPDDYILPVAGRPMIQPRFADTLFFRLQYLDGGPALDEHVRTFGQTIPAERFPKESCEHLRLIAEIGSSPAHWDRVKIFERTRGLRVVIRNAPEGTLWVRGVVRASGGRLFPFGRRARPLEDGLRGVIVPYPTAGNRGQIGVVNGYVITDGVGRTLRRFHPPEGPADGETIQVDLGH